MEKVRILVFFVIVMSFGASAMIVCGRDVALQPPPVNSNRGDAQPKKTLRAFGSEQEMTAYFRQIAEEARRELSRRMPSKSAPEASSATAEGLTQANADEKAKGENEESVT